VVGDLVQAPPPQLCDFPPRTIALRPRGSRGSPRFAYDSNGNLLTRTDARGLILCFGTLSAGSCTQPTNGKGYDAINRPLNKTYSDSTPSVTLTYDTATLGKHRLASVANSVSTTNK